MINIYCDESCHLERDGNDIMVLGGISCPKDLKSEIFDDIRKIKTRHNLSSFFEVKWTKVSMQMIEFYLELLDYFFQNENLRFRGIVATNKSKLDHKKFNNGSYDEWYYKMYYLLLNPMTNDYEEYQILIDRKDTLGGPKVKKLHDILCNSKHDFNKEHIKSVNQIDSKESEVLQLTDLLIGALSYYHRNLYLGTDGGEGKKAVIDSLILDHEIALGRKTPFSTNKFNIFIWTPRGAV